MEYCESTLAKYLKERETIDSSVCYDFLRQIIDGVAFLHNKDIIHRDLKPDNILIQKNQIKITDFGLAKIIDASIWPDATTYVGSQLYASPEQFAGKPYNSTTDIYSLGIIFYEIQFIFLTDMERILTLQSLRNTLQMSTNTQYNELIITMLDENPMKRPSISMIRNYVDPILFHPAVFCRDIVWEIVYSIL